MQQVEQIGETEILIKFTGLDADRYHGVDMRLLGRSLAGFDRIISDGLILISQSRVPKHRERCPILVIAKEPRRGSAEFYGDLAPVVGLFPFIWPVLEEGIGNVVWNWVSFVLESLGGRKTDAEKHLEAIIRLREIEAQERHLSEERWHEQMGEFRDKTFQVLGKLIDASQQAVSPVGPSAAAISFQGAPAPRAEEWPLVTEIDAAKADAIRSGGDFDVGDLQIMALKTDGFVFHNRKLNVHHPEGLGRFIAADVKDPIFDKEENAYARAASRKATIRVQAKPVYRGGKLERIYIMDFAGEVDEAA